MFHFSAKVFGVAESSEGDGVTALVFAEQSDGSGWTFEIQSSGTLAASSENGELYCLVFAATQTFYGGIESWRIIDSMLQIYLSEPACKCFEIVDGVTILLDPLIDSQQVIGWLEQIVQLR
jgi:hypothetical protein